MQLVLAHVHGVDARGAVLEQTVRETAGGGTGIKTDHTAHVELEIVQDGQQLVGAATDEALLPQQLEDRAFGIGMPGLVHLLGRGAGGQSFGGERHLAGHDETAGLFTAFGQALHEDQLIRALAGDFCTHGRTVACRPGAGNRAGTGGRNTCAEAAPVEASEAPRVRDRDACPLRRDLPPWSLSDTTGEAPVPEDLRRGAVRRAASVPSPPSCARPAGARSLPAVGRPRQTSLSSGLCRDGGSALPGAGKNSGKTSFRRGRGLAKAAFMGY